MFKVFTPAGRKARVGLAALTALALLTGVGLPRLLPPAQAANPTVILNPQDPGGHNVNVSEGLSGTQTATVNFVLSADNPDPVTVTFSTRDGHIKDDRVTKDDAFSAATADVDYVPQTDGKVTFAPHTGTTVKGVAFSIKGDQAFEPNEVFSVVVTDITTGYDKGTPGYVTINNDDSPPSVSLDDASAPETNSGITKMQFTLRLSAPLGQDDHVRVTTQAARPIPPARPGQDPTPQPQAKGGTAPPASTTDFITQTNQDVLIPANKLSIPVYVDVVGDTRDEVDEKFELQLSQTPGSALTPTDYGTGTILDDDAVPVLDITDTAVLEGPLDSTHCTEGTASPGDEDFTTCKKMVFNVTLTPASDKRVRVDWATAPRSATANVDYDSAGGSYDDTPGPLNNDTALYFEPGDTSKQVFAYVLGDNTAEPDERFAVDLSNPSNATIGHGEAFGVIQNDDPGGNFPTVKVANANPPNVSESTANTSFTFTANWPSTLPPTQGQPITVFYTTADGPENGGCGIARSTTDYTTTSGSFTLNWNVQNTASQTVTVPIKNDALHEGAECFQMQISDAGNASVTDAVGEASITDDDAAPKASIAATTTVTEGTGTDPTLAHVNVTLDKASGDPVTVNYSTPQPNGATPAANDDDYVNTVGNVVFDPGQISKSFDVKVKADSIDEPDEKFDVAITSSDVTVDKGAGVVLIEDDDNAPTVSISSPSVTETTGGNNTATFVVSLSSVSGKDVTVTATTADGTAKQPDDYTSKTQLLTIPAGTNPARADFVVTVIGDNVNEADETFTAVLSGATNATIAASPNNTGTATIHDDDTAATTLSINDVTVNEGNTGTTNATFTVTKAGATTQNATVHYATADGTATQPGDYTQTVGDLTFAPNETTKTIDVPVKGDTADEQDETFTVNLSQVAGATIADGTGTGTITDDDVPPGSPTISVGNATAAEGDKATFTFSLTAAADADMTVNYSTADGTAKAPGDYTAIPAGVATITAGQTTKTVDVQTIEDTTSEPQETFTLTINNASGANIDQAHKTGTGTINDDDAGPTKAQMTTGAGPGGGPHIQSFVTNSGNPVASFMDGAESTGKRVARGDVDGDGVDEIITGSGPNSPAVVSVYSAAGQLRASVFAYGGGRFYGGVFVAAGDVDGDGKAEIITGAGPGGGPHVIVWKVAGQSLNPTSGGFYAYGPEFAGGVTVAAADLTGDGKAEILTGPGAGGGPHVRSFDKDGNPGVVGFMAYTTPDNKPNWTGGVNVAAGDVDGDGKAEIVVVPWSGGGPHLRLFNNDGSLRNGGIMVGSPTFPGGLTVAMGDLSGDGKAEIIVGVWTGTNRIKAYTGDLNAIPSIDFQPYGEGFKGGNFVAIGKG